MPAAPAAKDGDGAYSGGTLGGTPAWLAEAAVPSAPLGMPLLPAAPPRGAAAGGGALSLAEAGGDGEGSDDSDVEIVDVGPDDADRDA